MRYQTSVETISFFTQYDYSMHNLISKNILILFPFFILTLLTFEIKI